MHPISSAMHLTFAVPGQSGGVHTLPSCSKVRLLGLPPTIVSCLSPSAVVFTAPAVLLAPAGHETTAATLGFTLYYIATHPEVEARVLEEIDAVLGSRFEPTVDDIPKLVRDTLSPGVSQSSTSVHVLRLLSVFSRAAARLCAVETPHCVSLTPCHRATPSPPHTHAHCICVAHDCRCTSRPRLSLPTQPNPTHPPTHPCHLMPPINLCHACVHRGLQSV